MEWEIETLSFFKERSECNHCIDSGFKQRSYSKHSFFYIILFFKGEKGNEIDRNSLIQITTVI